VHKCLHHRVPIYLKDKFVYRSQVHNRQLRSVDNNDLSVGFCRGSRIEGNISRVEGRGSRVNCLLSHKKKIIRLIRFIEDICMAKRRVIVPGVSCVEGGNWRREFIVNNAEQRTKGRK